MSAKPSEIRAFLLRYAAKRGLTVKEHLSPSWETGKGGKEGLTCWYCHVQNSEKTKSATAVSYQGPDNALAMAFLHFGNPELDFLPESV